MICPECNAKNKKDAKKCTNCGTKLVEQNETNVVRTKNKIIIKPRKKSKLTERNVEEVIGKFETVENLEDLGIEEKTEVLDIPNILEQTSEVEDTEKPVEVLEQVETPVETLEEIEVDNNQVNLDIPDVLTIDNSLNDNSLNNIESLQIDTSLSDGEVLEVDEPVNSVPEIIETQEEKQEVVKESNKNSNLPYIIIGVILAILLAICIVIIIYNKR